MRQLFKNRDPCSSVLLPHRPWLPGRGSCRAASLSYSRSLEHVLSRVPGLHVPSWWTVVYRAVSTINFCIYWAGFFFGVAFLFGLMFLVGFFKGCWSIQEMEDFQVSNAHNILTQLAQHFHSVALHKDEKSFTAMVVWWKRWRWNSIYVTKLLGFIAQRNEALYSLFFSISHASGPHLQLVNAMC